MKKINIPLFIGAFVVLAILVIMIFPGKLATINPYGTQGAKSIINELGISEVKSPPFSPDETFIMGTDQIGRDIYSLIIYGTRLTVTLSLLIVIGRFLLAVPIGIIAGFGNAFCSKLISQFNIIFSALPALLFSYIVLRMDYFMSLFKAQSILAFVIVLTLVGWGKLASIIEERVKDIVASPYIKGEIAIGKRKFMIAIQNVLSHLAPELIVLSFMEVALALTIIMELGVLGDYVGNLRIIDDTSNGIVSAMNISFEPEWASMLATSRYYVTTASWTVIYPVMAFFISILGFNLLGEGLRIEMQKRDIHMKYKVKRLISKSLTYTSTVKAKVAIGILLISIFSISIFVNLPETNNLKSISCSAFSNINMQSQKEVIIGSKEAESLANNISEVFKDMGLKPINEKGYVQEYDIDDYYICTESKLTLKKNNGKVEDFQVNEDYSIGSYNNFNLSGLVYNTAKEDLYNIKDYSKFNEKFILIDMNYYSLKNIEGFITKIFTNSSAKGILCVKPEGESISVSIGKEKYKEPVVYITKEMAEQLKGEEEVSLSIKVDKLGNKGRNIIGILPGTDPVVGNQTIILGIGYNYTSNYKDIGIKRILYGLELLNTLMEEGKQKRTIILAFWDGNLNEELNGIRDYIEKKMYSPKDSVLYMDLTNINGDNFNTLYYDDTFAPVYRYFAWSFNHSFKEQLKSQDISIEKIKKGRVSVENYQYDNNSHEIMFNKEGIATISLETRNIPKEEKHTLEEVMNNILITMKKINY